jgi:hypothetical protein
MKEMSLRTKQGLKVLEAAALLGVLGDGLLRATPWGLNVLLCTGAIVTAAVAMLRRSPRRALSGVGHSLLLSAILFAASFAWRDSPTLNFLAGVGVLLSLGLMMWRARGGRIWLAGITEYALGIFAAGVSILFTGFPLLFSDVRWRELPGAGWTRHLKAVALGALIALPLLILFGGLLTSADAAFERMIGSLFLGNHEEAIKHIFLAFVMAWMAGGFLRGLLLGREVKIVNGKAVFVPEPSAQAPFMQDAVPAAPPLANNGTPIVNITTRAVRHEPVSLGIVETGVALGLLNMLFLAFVLSQLRYYFGDASLVQGSTGLTFSEYYRRGFFELVTVAALVLPMLLGLHWLLRKGNAAHERVFRLLATFQIFLLFVMMASAVRRMLLYQSVYGLTEQRLYTTAFMVWLAIVFLWFIATALCGQRERFACGALVAGMLVVMTLHVINPDALIVRVNIRHAQAGAYFDAHYDSTLSADAAPALIESLGVLNEDDRRILSAQLLGRSNADEMRGDWRNWNWARAGRLSSVLASEYSLQVMATTPPPPPPPMPPAQDQPPPPTPPAVNQAEASSSSSSSSRASTIESVEGAGRFKAPQTNSSKRIPRGRQSVSSRRGFR